MDKSFSFREFVESFGDARAFNLRFAGREDQNPTAGGLIAARSGGLYGDPNMLIKKRDREIFAKDVPPGAKVVNIDADGEYYYRVLEMPDGTFKVQQAVTIEDNESWIELPANQVTWHDKRGEWFSHWNKAVKYRPGDDN